MSSFDDPEKHFLGNLLEDDPGSSVTSATSPFAGINGSTSTALTSQVPTVGPVMCPTELSMSNAWPEPPPPYSPRHESWGLPSNANTTLLGSSSLTSSNWFPFTDQKETSSNEILSSLNLAAGSSSPALPSTPSRVPHHPSSQVHHFHHNLHHHTHTHNVVQNHYFGAPPPGLESFGPTRTSSTSSSQIYDAIPNPSWNYTGLSNINADSNVLFSDWKNKNSSQTSPVSTVVSESSISSNLETRPVHPPLSPSEVVEIAKEKKNVSKSYAEHLSKSTAGTQKKGAPIGAEKKQKQELAKKMSNQLPIESIATRIVVKGQPHSAPVVSRMPFSYRDVAARSDHTSSSNHPNHQPDELQRKELSSADLKLNDSKAVRTKNNDHRETGKTRNTIDPTDFNKKNRVDNEFQKINNRKNKKEKAVTEVAAPVIFEGVHPVDSSSRYDVLKNLESPNQSYHEKKSANGRPPLIQKIFSRSSSPADDIIDTEEEDPHRVRSSSTHVHQNGNGQVKKDQRKRVAQVNQRRRKGRKEEPSWLQNAFSTFVDVLFFVWGYACFGLQWTLLLIVEVCQKIADIFVTFGKSLWAGTCKGLRNVILAFVYLCFFVVFAIKSVVVRLLTFINMIGAEESDETVEEQDWGCKKEIPIATNATEFADRLSRETIRDAYSVFGLRSDCSDDDIKRNYKRLAALVSPDKCTIDAADQVYELVDVAFSAIGYKDSRSEYTLENLKNNEVHEQLISVWNDMTKAVEEARNTIFCDCENTHFRVATSISPSQARSCKRCGVKHPAKQNDIWVEKRHLGLTSTYYTCTDNVVYDITSWATCKSQRAMLKNMRAHTHNVQYRLLSPMNSDFDAQSQYYNSSYPSSSTDARFLSDLQEEYSTLLRQRSLAQISFKNCEPREEDRSRRAANRRQKRWR
ncbi:DnaJ homolog dnj-5 [Caenorhabditis elegans]|uniref:Isoform C of DnaJ homolog dnj-5 n=1 Tax=Caenorhabditis elegans TaxID=6239 RepID=Q09446-3|nr:DnaJ homolog dnj-5 [Caenorhabditis elegans]CCD62848.1 DnaJ homolog dnj-5 [Caenorhabditis elegans]|eukprot:NP_741015.1 DnaJ homolog dnj-5 [Caenorhabditis elegans]